LIGPALVLLLQVTPPLDPREAGPFRSCLGLLDEAAIPQCRAVLESPLPAGRRAIALRILGQRLAAVERWDEATEAYRRWVELEPEEPEALRRYGEVLLVAGRAEQAIGALRESVLWGAEDARAHGWLGVALNAAGRHSEAVRSFEDALEVDPTFFAARPGARSAFEASQRGERWPGPAREMP
jgi:tetratricopeptide (TPR) repeat protein